MNERELYLSNCSIKDSTTFILEMLVLPKQKYFYFGFLFSEMDFEKQLVQLQNILALRLEFVNKQLNEPHSLASSQKILLSKEANTELD